MPNTTIQQPIAAEVERDIHGDGGAVYTAYRMPSAAGDRWADITDVPCPVEGCGQTLVWYEAGYVPGYRVCMAATGEGRCDPGTLRHRFVLDGAREFPETTLILDD